MAEWLPPKWRHTALEVGVYVRVLTFQFFQKPLSIFMMAAV